MYWFELSHPAQAARRMLEVKGVEHELVHVLPGTQRVHLRLAGFRGGTVPALVLDGRRVQGSRAIARALDAAVPSPPFFAADDDAARAAIVAAERWGDEELQPLPRVLLRWGLVRDMGLRVWLARQERLPAPRLAGRLSGPTAWYYARAVGADEARARRALAELPALLDRADALLAEGVLVPVAPNAATLQVLASVRALDGFEDLRDIVGAHACAGAARRLMPDCPGPVPAFLPRGWLGA